MLKEIFTSVFVSLLVFPLAKAQTRMCDNGLRAPAQHPFAYAYRGNCCEGIYIQEVSNALLSVVSFTRYFEDYDQNAAKDLIVSWSVPKGSAFALRAQGIRPGLYYRMDTQLNDSTRFVWSKNVLSALEIKKKDIGVIGWTKLTLGEKERPVLLPLAINQSGINKTDQYQLLLIPGRELNEVYITLSQIDADGKSLLYLRDGEPLKQGYYPAARQISVPLSGIEKSGIYLLELGAKLRNGESASTEVYFYYSVE